MTRIRTACPDCGEVEIGPSDVALHLARDAGGAVGTSSWYGFDCPSCAVAVRKPADARIAQLLIGGGVADVVDESKAASSGHPERPMDAPPLTADDLLDFVLALATEDLLAREASAVR